MERDLIKQRINANNKRIEEIMSLNTFVLNNMVAELLKENAALQKQCSHEFKDGYCEYCYLSEEKL